MFRTEQLTYLSLTLEEKDYLRPSLCSSCEMQNSDAQCFELKGSEGQCSEVHGSVVEPQSKKSVYLINKISLTFYCLTFFFLLGAISYPSHGEEYDLKVVKITGQTDKIDLAGHFEYFQTEKALTTRDAISQSQNWQPYGDETINFGYTDEVVWLRAQMSFENFRDDTYFLEIGYPLLDRITVTLFENGLTSQHFESGDLIPISEREYKSSKFLFPLALKPGKDYRLIIAVSSTSSVQLPITLWSRDSYTFDSHRSLMFTGIFYGILILAVIYNLFLYYSTKNIRFFYYVCYVASFTFFYASIQGHSSVYIWPEIPFLIQFGVPIFVNLATISFIYFSNSLLLTKTHLPHLFNITRYAVISAIAVLIVLPILEYQYATQLSAILVSLMAITVITISIIRISQGSNLAKFLLIAFTMILVGTLLMALNKFGILPRNEFTENAQAIGALVEIILLSLLLGNQMNKLQKEKVALQEQATHVLEEKVQERTNELHRSLMQVSTLAQRLSDLSSCDPLTDLKNRRYLDEQLTKEWNRLQRVNGHMTILVVDIDHFKRINDTYGHIIGDECLIKLASALRTVVKRPADVVARYGGEEFVIALTDTPLDGGICVAENIMKEVAKIDIETKSEPVKFTLSIGIAHTHPARGNSYNQLIDQADQVLYKAKKEGRNQYRIYEDE